jgi:hypothetical protein
MAKQAYVYSGTDWVPLASDVTTITGYQTKALAQASNRNIIINGAMQVAQRATSVAALASDGYYTADRFAMLIRGSSVWTQSVENDAPTGSGFRKSLKMLCTTAVASPLTTNRLYINQPIEGQNVQILKKGTSSAELLTVSFWVKANLTGTYVVQLFDYFNSRQVSKAYTISASATWEKKTITFPADTTGALTNDNNAQFEVRFWLLAGSGFSSGTMSGAWESSTNANSAVGQVNLAAATSNYFQITGVQFEVGDVATPFEFKSVGDGLLECQRYYEKTYNLETALGTGVAPGWVGAVTSSATTETGGSAFKVVKRGTPTITLYNAISGASGAVYRVSDAASVSSSVNYIGNNGFGLINVSSNNSFYYHYVANAEL